MPQSLEEKIDSKFSEFSAKLNSMDNRIKLLESAKESCISSSLSSSDSQAAVGNARNEALQIYRYVLST